jgi:hypothetical protein
MLSLMLQVQIEHNHNEKMNIRGFVPPRNAIQAEAAIDISASPEYVASLYRNVEKWGETFPATIASARITNYGTNWKEIDVEHKKERRVPNTLIDLSDNEIALKESKRKFSASFINRFEPASDGTHYVIRAYIRLKGIYRLLKPLLKGYVRRQAIKQMKTYVLSPLKAAAEKRLPYGPE